MIKKFQNLIKILENERQKLIYENSKTENIYLFVHNLNIISEIVDCKELLNKAELYEKILKENQLLKEKNCLLKEVIDLLKCYINLKIENNGGGK